VILKKLELAVNGAHESKRLFSKFRGWGVDWTGRVSGVLFFFLKRMVLVARLPWPYLYPPKKPVFFHPTRGSVSMVHSNAPQHWQWKSLVFTQCPRYPEKNWGRCVTRLGDLHAWRIVRGRRTFFPYGAGKYGVHCYLIGVRLNHVYPRWERAGG